MNASLLQCGENSDNFALIDYPHVLNKLQETVGIRNILSERGQIHRSASLRWLWSGRIICLAWYREFSRVCENPGFMRNGLRHMSQSFKVFLVQRKFGWRGKLLIQRVAQYHCNL